MISFALLTTWEWGMENGEWAERLPVLLPFSIPHSPFPAPTGANP